MCKVSEVTDCNQLLFVNFLGRFIWRNDCENDIYAVHPNRYKFREKFEYAPVDLIVFNYLWCNMNEYEGVERLDL
jgi:hypothetical protein